MVIIMVSSSLSRNGGSLFRKLSWKCSCSQLIFVNKGSLCCEAAFFKVNKNLFNTDQILIYLWMINSVPLFYHYKAGLLTWSIAVQWLSFIQLLRTPVSFRVKLKLRDWHKEKGKNWALSTHMSCKSFKLN